MRFKPSVSSLQTKICHAARGCLRCMTALASKECFSEGDYFDTSKHRLKQGIFGIPTEIPLVEIDFENDKFQGKILCGLVDSLHYGVGLLVGNDLEGIMPLTVT